MVMERLMSMLVTGSVLLLSVQVTTCGSSASRAMRENEKRVREAICMAEYGTPVCPDENRSVIAAAPVQHQAISADTARASGTSASSQKGKLEYFGPEKPADPFLRLHSFNFEERKTACTELLTSKVDPRRVSDALLEILTTEQDALRLRASMYCAMELGSAGGQLTPFVQSILERSLREDLRKADYQVVYLEEETFSALTAVSPDKEETARFLTSLTGATAGSSHACESGSESGNNRTVWKGYSQDITRPQRADRARFGTLRHPQPWSSRGE